MLVFIAACGGASGSEDAAFPDALAGLDVASSDAEAIDAPIAADAAPDDATIADGGEGDSGAVDAGVDDAGGSDAEASDAIAPDAEVSDAEASDAEASDAEASDALDADLDASAIDASAVCLCPTDEATINQYWANGPDDIWAVGRYNPGFSNHVGAIFHWDSYGWSAPEIETPIGGPSGPYQTFYAFDFVAGRPSFSGGSEVQAIGEYQERVRAQWPWTNNFVFADYPGYGDCPRASTGIWVSQNGSLTIITGEWSDVTGLGGSCADPMYSGTVTLSPPNSMPSPTDTISNCDGARLVSRPSFASWDPNAAAVQEHWEASCTAIGAHLRPDGTIDHYPVTLTGSGDDVYAYGPASWVLLAGATLVGVPCGFPRVYARDANSDLYSFDGTGSWVLATQDEPLIASATFCQTTDAPLPPLPSCTCTPRPDAGVPDSGLPLSRASVNNNDTEGNWHSRNPAASADGRYVVFVAQATNLVPHDLNQATDVFVRDRQASTTTRLTDSVFEPVQVTISADGRRVVYLRADSANQDAWVIDLLTNTTTIAGVANDGTWANDRILNAIISPDGNDVVFASAADNLVAGDANAVSDVFLRDLVNSTTVRISVASNGAEGNSASTSDNEKGPAISGDGRYVVFASFANNLVAGDTNNNQDIFVHDMLTGTTVLASVSSAGVQANGYSDAPAISADGRWVTFYSGANNLVTGDTNGTFDVFVHDMQTGATSRASVSSTGTQANGSSGTSSLSGDGRYVVFSSVANNLVAGDTNTFRDTFVRDMQTGLTVRTDDYWNGTQALSPVTFTAISGDGRTILLSTGLDLLGASDQNYSEDVYVLDNPL